MKRREFLKRAGMATAASGLSFADSGTAAIIVERDDYLANRPPVKWAVGELQQAFKERAVESRVIPRLADATASDRCILVANQGGAAESVRLSENAMGGRRVLQAGGTDIRGLVYAVLELADRVRYAPAAFDALRLPAQVSERPANAIRSMSRCFQSDVEDLGWYHDRAMWREYLTMLAYHRFNRFNLCLGLAYDFPRGVTDSYFFFPYPFLLDVPGFKVRATGLPDSERDRNLETLRFISDETAARGLHFQLGLWTHQYEFENSPNVNHRIEGLTAANHAEYCKQAAGALLKACPAIAGLTLRVHGESGIPEGSYDFWRTLFAGISGCGRRVEIDMHAKGMDQKMIDIALATGMPVNISPKYWAEHMGMPYHQAGIRELEMPPEGEADHGVFALSNGSRRFLRYGYGDLLTEGRKYGILHRIWPGTQRVLLWGDPKFAAGYGRASSFCGDLGVEWCEPLSFKGRKGSGKSGGRCAYADATLNPKYDWQKFAYTYRVWGRCLYNPDADPDQWRRWLRQEFGDDAPQAEEALANASRILPIVTTVHGASGSNNTYWPEMYTNMPIVDEKRKQPYTDTPKPRVFGMASPFDPQIFATADEFAEDKATDKISPLEVADWLEKLSQRASENMAKVAKNDSAEFRRWELDVAILSGLGRFFAGKMRAAVHWQRSGGGQRYPGAVAAAISNYKTARDAWAEFANLAKGRYANDITYGSVPHMRGHWLDRLAEIDADLADMEKAGPGGSIASKKADLVKKRTQFSHVAAPRFEPGKPLAIELSGPDLQQPRMYYRHVNQAERWRVAKLERKGRVYGAVIPAEYTNSKYALQYYFADQGTLHPGFGEDLCGTPYFVVRS
jgi:hypothetical protein